MMTEEEIRKLYPEFDYWVHKDKGFICAGHGEYHIMLWYEFLKQRKEKNEKIDAPQHSSLGECQLVGSSSRT